MQPLKGTVFFDSQGNRGRFQDRIELVFYDTDSRRQFAIVKPISVIVGNREDYEALKPIAPYVPRIILRKEPVIDINITDGERPASISSVRWVKSLPQYHIPEALKWTLDLPSMGNKIKLLKSGFILGELSPDMHTKRFHTLLYMEEHQSK